MRKVLIHFPNDARMVKNKIFDTSLDVNFSIFRDLQIDCKKKGISVQTADMMPWNKAQIILIFDAPHGWKLNEWKQIKLFRNKTVLFSFEPPIVNPFNHLKIYHKNFRKIYTLNDGVVDNKKYFRFYWPQSSFGFNTRPINFHKKKFITLINGNKQQFFPFKLISPFGKELYSARISFINFCDDNIPNAFDLWGYGWNKPKKHSPKEALLGYRKYQVYRGTTKNKIKTLSMYKYNLCFENMTDIKGYITEKLFDSFKARCVPIYWGASNINDYIPRECFIDFRKFLDYKKLLDHIYTISEKEYNQYIVNISRLLSDKTFLKRWFEDGLAKSVINLSDSFD